MAVGKGSYFKGWASTLPNQTSANTGKSGKKVYVGQVLSVDYKGSNAGSIRVRLIGVRKDTTDDEVTDIAYPANINMVKYPIPGELVLVLTGIQNQVAKNKFVTALYYITTLTSNQSITFNSDPYLGKTIPANEADNIFTPEYEHRFESKIKSLSSFTQDRGGQATIKEHAQLQPSEGDSIAQGRFGTGVRLGSTTLNSVDEWSQKGGVAGDPIVIFSTQRDLQLGNKSTRYESVNTDDASFYVCSSQNIPVELATSTRLRSRLYEHNKTSK
tara:strand:+ start:2101 stop:2916 length:816 start_codon:yes stop_codon:yes gene_type:complete